MPLESMYSEMMMVIDANWQDTGSLECYSIESLCVEFARGPI
jgi:hypothetical protein